MPDGIKVNYAAIDHAKGEMAANRAALQSTHDQLTHDLLKLESWQGGASEAYHHAKQQWDQAFEEILHFLDSLTRAVDDANIRYQQGEKTNIDSFT